jgi:enoyl-CoA hydratase
MSTTHPYETFIFDEPVPGVGRVTLNRHAQLNAINIRMLDEFEHLFRWLSGDCPIRVLVITGMGRGFCAGADLNDADVYRESEAFADPDHFLRLVQERYAALILGIRNIPQPVIAAVNGPAAGGGFCLALACDIRIASPEAYFVASFINIGLSGGELGISYMLPRLIGLSMTADIIYTGRKVTSDEAKRIGLVSERVPKERLMEVTLACAKSMAGKSAGGLTLTKRVLEQNIDAPSLKAAMDLENRNQTLMVFSGEFFKLIAPFFKSKK